jgi:hypothetical protein
MNRMQREILWTQCLIAALILTVADNNWARGVAIIVIVTNVLEVVVLAFTKGLTTKWQ